MKTLLAFFSLALAGTACQPRAAATRVVAAPPSPVAVQPARHTPTAAPAGLELLHTYDVGRLFRLRNTHDDALVVEPQDGFFGPSRYHIEMAFLKVQRDSAEPMVYRVWGKSRFKKVVTPFSGTIRLRSVVKQAKYDAAGSEDMGYSDYAYYQKLPAYTVTGTFELREDATQPGAGVFRGTVALDLAIKAHNAIERECLTLETPTQMGELKFSGTWASYTTSRVQPVVWVGSSLYRGPEAFQDLYVTKPFERSAHINPKYASLGWNKWDNVEWWADAPGSAPAM